jgi:4-alpha-glucanotransferase
MCCAENDYDFWVARMRTQLRLFDVVRIDHFRGFEAFWEIPGDAETAIDGRWVSAGGDGLFARLEREFGRLPWWRRTSASSPRGSRRCAAKYRMPGMKILQFAFGSGPENPTCPSIT